MPSKTPAFLILILVILLTSSCVSEGEGQGGSISGRVYARTYLGDYVPAGFATILVEGEHLETIVRTTPDGYYFTYLPIGTYTMTATLSTVTLDYFQSKIISLWSSSEITINFYLEPIINSRFSSISITIMLGGLPSHLSTELTINDRPPELINGESPFIFEVERETSHTISVQPYVTDSENTRYYCPDNIWNFDGTIVTTDDADIIHTFDYETEYFLYVMSPHGAASKKSGWYAKESLISLTAPLEVNINRGEKYVFDGWIIGNSENSDSNINFNIRSPLEIRAKYHREYFLQLNSIYGNPTGIGWYEDGSTATINVEKELPMPSFFGFLGGKIIFDKWNGEFQSRSNIADVYMDSSKIINAHWREDYTITFIIGVSILFIIIALLALVILKRHKKII
ncbi:hypothetical protein [[Eubacterium] cellulosolvens]